MNHNSMLDGFVMTASCPWENLSPVKTMMKAALYKIPCLGPVLKSCGHFPIYFKSKKLGDFSVDKDKVKAVMENVTAHIKANG